MHIVLLCVGLDLYSVNDIVSPDISGANGIYHFCISFAVTRSIFSIEYCSTIDVRLLGPTEPAWLPEFYEALDSFRGRDFVRPSSWKY